MEAFRWASEIEDPESAEELAQDGVKYVPRFAAMEAKINASALILLHGDWQSPRPILLGWVIVASLQTADLHYAL